MRLPLTTYHANLPRSEAILPWSPTEGKSGDRCSTRTCRPRRHPARRGAGCAHPVRRLEDAGPGRPPDDPGVPPRRLAGHRFSVLRVLHRQGAGRGGRADRLGRAGGQGRVRSTDLLAAQAARPGGQRRRDVHPPRGRAARAAGLGAARARARAGLHAAPHAAANGPADAGESSRPGRVAHPRWQDTADRRTRAGGDGDRCARGIAAVLRRTKGAGRVRRRRRGGTGGPRRAQGVVTIRRSLSAAPLGAPEFTPAERLQNSVTRDRAGNHLAVLEDLRIGGCRASPGFGGATHTCERDTGNGSVEVLNRELKVGRGGPLGENYVDGPSRGGVQERGEKSAVHNPTLVAVFGSRHDLDDGLVRVGAYVGKAEQVGEVSRASLGGLWLQRRGRHGRTVVNRLAFAPRSWRALARLRRAVRQPRRARANVRG